MQRDRKIGKPRVRRRTAEIALLSVDNLRSSWGPLTRRFVSQDGVVVLAWEGHGLKVEDHRVVNRYTTTALVDLLVSVRQGRTVVMLYEFVGDATWAGARRIADATKCRTVELSPRTWWTPWPYRRRVLWVRRRRVKWEEVLTDDTG